MRQVTATEKYRAVNEGKMAKGEFVRQMRMAYPSVISQWNSYGDTVNILKNRGYITEKAGVESYDSRYDLNISPNSIDRGVRYELQGMGHDPVEVKDKELVAKVTDRVVKNLKKDPLHYINLLAKESSHTDKHDEAKEVKRGAADKDTFNDMKKADLREGTEDKKELPKSIADKERDQIEKDAMKAKGMIKENPRENIIKVASVIRGKYGEIPGFTSILKSFLQTHQDDIKAGRVTDPLAEFDDFIDLNYDRLDEKEDPVNEMSPEMSNVVAFLATGAGIQGASHVAGKLIKALENGRFGEKGKEIAQDIHNLAKTDVEENLEEEPNEGNKYEYERLKAIKHGKDTFTIDGETEKVKGVDTDDKKRAAQLKESVKNIITKVLEEQMVNEAATNELARLAEDYQEFPGMKQSIIALQDIVTDIESFYDKTRDKIQKVYNSIGEIRNEEGLKVGGFLAPTIEAAFNKDLRPIAKKGFTKGLEAPKVKTMSSKEFDDMKQQQGIEEEPKSTVFTPNF